MARFLGLEDAERTARQYPDTFFIPSNEDREHQKVGDSVKLLFLLADPNEEEPRAERMWVTITEELSPSTPYRGTLENRPVHIDDLTIGDEITFDARHIAGIAVRDTDPRWVDSYELKAVVSRMCLEEGEVVRFLYREQSDREGDSGWRLLTCHEPDGYTDDPSNIRIVDVGYMLDKDPSLLEPMRESVGAVFEREDRGGQWKRVTDWAPGE